MMDDLYQSIRERAYELAEQLRANDETRAKELNITVDQYSRWRTGQLVPEVDKAMLREMGK